jgi:RloB-like protein
VAPRRRVSKDAIRPEVLAFVEGEVTEEQYLIHFGRLHRAKMTFRVADFHGVPFSLVSRAVETKKAEERDSRRGRGRARDEYWCVFDVDVHEKLIEAIDLAARNGIQLAISNPCIELWFLIHFEDQFAFIERHDAQRAAKAHTRCDKTLTREALEALGERFPAAKDRARALESKHVGDGTPAPGNPSSDVWRIIDSIISR